NPSMMVLYRDSGERTTLTFQGKGHVQNDDATRKKLWDMIPEVERNHETWESGAPLIIDLDRVDGGTPDGRVRVACKKELPGLSDIGNRDPTVQSRSLCVCRGRTYFLRAVRAWVAP